MAPIIKTTGPIHFEDLDPHRFEDLVRELIYDLKDWRSIEATGKGGSDDGFDVRAWEKTEEITNEGEEEDDVGTHPMDGNLWMIQCKREKELGPKRIGQIINEAVNEKNSPYGYVLAAPVNFTKKSYDAFHDILRKKKVMEFHLWGKPELEDMLHQPKNDHILFTFFGISLVAKRRSRTTEKKFAINNKNKLLRVLSEGAFDNSMHKSVLLRDFEDKYYPWDEKYKDFDKKPRWAEHIVQSYHPYGLMIDVSERYAYVDHEKREWDYTEAADLVYREGDTEKHQNDQEHYQLQNKIENFWKHLPRRNQAKLENIGIVRFADMLIVDDKGDVVYKMPHIYLDFQYHGGPFRAIWHYLKGDKKTVDLDEAGYKRVRVFPKVFPDVKKGKLYEDKTIVFDEETWRLIRIATGVIEHNFFDVDGRYNFLNQADIIGISGVSPIEHEPNFLRITYKYSTTVQRYMKNKSQDERASIDRQVGRKVKADEKINVYEFERTYRGL